MRKTRAFAPPVVGGSIILVIFSVLCMVSFAILSLATVQADRRIADAAADAVTDYYTADAQAEKILAQLRAGKQPDGITADGDLYSYSVTISDTQKLDVEVCIDGDRWTVLKWQAVSATDWVPDNSLNIWSGEDEK